MILCEIIKFADDRKLGSESCQDAGGFCRLEGHLEAGRIGCQKLHKQSPAFGKEQPQTGAQATMAAKCKLDCFPESTACKSTGSEYSPLFTCLTWDMMSSFGTPPVQEKC